MQYGFQIEKNIIIKLSDNSNLRISAERIGSDYIKGSYITHMLFSLSNIEQNKLMERGIDIALSILDGDKEKNLTSTDIATIVRDCLKSVQDKKVPDVKQIRENWLTDKRFDDRKKKGRPKGKAEDKAKLRDKITENIINNYQHSVG